MPVGNRPPPPRLRSQLSHVFDVDDNDAQPSPPYHPTATFTGGLELPPQDSPAYRSNVTLHMGPPDETARSHDAQERKDAADAEGRDRPTVQFPADVKRAPTTHQPGPQVRQDTGTSSRASSIAGTDDDYEADEDYDWSGEEDLVDEEAKFEQKMGIKQKPKGWGLKRILTLLLSTLVGSVFLAGVLVTGPLLVQFYWYKPHPTEHRRYVKDNVEAWCFWAAAQLIVSWILALLVDIVPGVVRTALSIAWGHVSEYVKTRLELYMSVKDNIKPVLYAASGWVSWIILFEVIYDLYNSGDEDSSRAGYTPRVYQVIEFLFFLALVICIQRMLSHFIAFTFHRTAFKERLDSVTEALRVIEVLRNYKPKPRPGLPRSGKSTPVLSALFTPAAEREGFLSSRPGTPAGGRRQGGYDSAADADVEDSPARTRDAKGKKRQSTPDPTAAPAAGHAYPPGAGAGARPSEDGDAADVALKAAKALRDAVLHDARNLRGKDAAASGLVWDVTSGREAKRLARAIFTALRERRRRNYLLPADFEPAFARAEDAQAAFRVFDTDNNGDLSRAEIKTTLLKVYKERRSLSRSMRDVGVALKTLDQILLFFALVVLFFISLSVFSVAIGSSLTSLYSIGIALSFIFKNSASSAFDAIMFLFVTHPFDTGDRCFIDDENLVVKQMGLFATVFTRVDGTETYYFNSQLFLKFIANCRRSGKTFENLSMQVAWTTPLSKLDELAKCMNEWLQTEENRWFEPSTGVTLQKIEFQRHLEITMGIGHNGTWQDWGLRMARKTAFHAAVQHYSRQLGIVAHASPMPVVYADADTHAFAPPTPTPLAEDDGGLLSPVDAPADEPVRPALGFLPPESQRADMRVRKTRRKAVLRSMGAGGGAD